VSKVSTVREKLEKYSPPNYAPLSFVPDMAEREWIEGVVENADGNDERVRILDFHSNYSASNLGHNHPDIVALKIERFIKKRPALVSRAAGMLAEFGELTEKIAELSGMDMVIPKNAGTEGFDVAVKTCRRWGYEVKGIKKDKAEIIVCINNFHGRSLAAIEASTDEESRAGFGPFGPEKAFIKIPFADTKALEEEITKNTAAFIVEPIQAEAGVIVPRDGYLLEAKRVCRENNVLFVLDEVQTGLGRTGKLFAWQHEGEEARPDGMILGKALGGGANIISMFISSRKVMERLRLGTEGSTFGGNPEACAVAIKALDLLSDPILLERVSSLGREFMEKLKAIESPFIREVRGRGLLIAVELTKEAGGTKHIWEELFKEGILAVKRENAIGFSPPLIIGEDNILIHGFEKIKKVLNPASV